MSPLIPDIVPHDAFSPAPADRQRWNDWYAEAFKISSARSLPLLPDHEEQLSAWIAERKRVIQEAERKLKPPVTQDTWKTYLIAAEGSPLVKIGLAKIPEARMAQLQTGQPMTLSLLWVCEGDYERKLHRWFADHRARGEWFDLTSLGDPTEVVAAALEGIKASER
ncbi:GIY-YIG nuclease family protein [Streptomyces sp. NPDC001268]|uniref:GIY-YIG nuclease family protein n=1 Tax=Streptomyces sp. NPDC001268 TaxID=3364553 RepID=UPI0036BA8511